jgi:16S rRNA (adenine1518-N6/adenine1519-N6)-dimethyltransferase
MVRAKKHLGQHFLIDEIIASNIVEACMRDLKTEALIEVGAGTGVLTKYLFKKNIPQLLALDVDEESIDYLHKQYPKQKENVQLLDFLEADINSIVKGPFSIIGNFPYNISSQILFKALEHRHECPLVVGMFQKEMAERAAAKPGSKIYGILSVLVQAFYDIEYLFTVNENAFNPPPKVKSGVIACRRNSTEQLACDEALFIKVVKTAFNQRRKQLKNSLSIFLVDGKILPDKFIMQRPEQLSYKSIGLIFFTFFSMFC